MGKLKDRVVTGPLWVARCRLLRLRTRRSWKRAAPRAQSVVDKLRLLAHFSRWLEGRSVGLEDLDSQNSGASSWPCGAWGSAAKAYAPRVAEPRVVARRHQGGRRRSRRRACTTSGLANRSGAGSVPAPPGAQNAGSGP